MGKFKTPGSLEHQLAMSATIRQFFNAHTTFCEEAGLSSWDFCCALANVQGMIMANLAQQTNDIDPKKAEKAYKAIAEMVQIAYENTIQNAKN